jgi:ribosomal protein S19
MRSTWKPDYFSKALLRLSENLSERKSLTTYKIYDKSSTIPSFLRDKRVLLHNGKTYVSFLIREHHVGRKFSQFIVCKKTGPSIHVKTNKKNKKSSRRNK